MKEKTKEHNLIKYEAYMEKTWFKAPVDVGIYELWDAV